MLTRLVALAAGAAAVFAFAPFGFSPVSVAALATVFWLWQHAATARDGGKSGRITVLVSHRFSTVRMADLIVVLDGARLVETGTHEELMRAPGRYAALHKLQAGIHGIH